MDRSAARPSDRTTAASTPLRDLSCFLAVSAGLYTVLVGADGGLSHMVATVVSAFQAYLGLG